MGKVMGGDLADGDEQSSLRIINLCVSKDMECLALRSTTNVAPSAPQDHLSRSPKQHPLGALEPISIYASFNQQSANT